MPVMFSLLPLEFQNLKRQTSDKYKNKRKQINLSNLFRRFCLITNSQQKIGIPVLSQML